MEADSRPMSTEGLGVSGHAALFTFIKGTG